MTLKTYGIFISYRRDSGFEMANLIAEKLCNAGYRVFLDVESIRSGKFDEQLYKSIEQCQDFIVVLSQNGLDRCYNETDWVRQEIIHAMQHGKNIIPVMLAGFAWPSIMPIEIEDLAHYQGIDAGNHNYFDASMDKLKSYLKSKCRKKASYFFIPAAIIIGVVLILTIVGLGFYLISSSPPPPPPTTLSVPENMVYIPGGTFMMGSPTSESERKNDETSHQIIVSDFYIGKREITVEEFHHFVNDTGYQTTAEEEGNGYVLGVDGKPGYHKGFNWLNPGFSQRNSQPVTQVSWYDAVMYCNWLSRQEGVREVYAISRSGNNRDVIWNTNANGYRLPTEAEWEYACRAGMTTPFSTGNNITTEQANYNGNMPYNNNTKGIFREKTTDVGIFSPNAWGLYDMHGNVWEWCWDRYGNYDNETLIDPKGTISGSRRIVRGGSWGSPGEDLRSSRRYWTEDPVRRSSYLGFRVVRSIELN